jgi:short-subunit dehydrogenase
VATGVLAIAWLDRLEALAREASEQGGSVVPLAADLGTPEGLASVVAKVGSLGGVDLLVNNAGIATCGDFRNASLEQELGAIRLNVNVVVTLTHAVLREMLQRRNGSIINLASIVAFQSFPPFAIYAATKAFALSFTEVVAEEVKGSGARILAVCPGAAKTEMSVFSQNEGLLGKLPSLSPDEIVSTALRALRRARGQDCWMAKRNARVHESSDASRRNPLDDGRVCQTAVASASPTRTGSRPSSGVSPACLNLVCPSAPSVSVQVIAVPVSIS